MAQIDEKQEAIAKIRMMIDNDVSAHAILDPEAEAASAEISTEAACKSAPDNVNGLSPHWIFSSPEKPINSYLLETDMCAQGNSSFKEFDELLRDFLSRGLPYEAIRYEDPILVSLDTHLSIITQRNS